MKKRHRSNHSFSPIVALAATVIAASFTRPAAADDWPQWRGVNRDGISAETGLARQWPEGGPPLVWKVESLGEGYGSASIAGDRVYVQGTEYERSALHCLDRQTGRPLWVRALGKALRQDKGNGPRGTPVVHGASVYALTEAGVLARVNVETGVDEWKVNILKEFNGRNIGWHLSESPLIHGDMVIVSPGGKKDASMVALNKKTGETIWTSKGLGGDAAYSSPIAANVDGLDVIINFTSWAGVGLRARDGAKLWEWRAPANGTANCSTPVYHDGSVFYSSGYGTGGGRLDLTRDGDGIKTREAWFTKDMMSHHGGVILVDGYIYGFSDSILTCLDYETGERKWRDRSVGKGSIASADGLLVLQSETFKVGLAEATPEGYREKGRFEIEDHGWASWAYPVISGGRLYIRNQQDLLCYDISEGGSR